MRKFCKRASVLALAALLAASALDCPSGTRSWTTATPDITTQIEISNEESKIEEGKDTGEPVTIRLVHYTGEQAKRDALDAMLAVFSGAYPEVKVDVEVVVSSSYIAIYKNYIVAEEAPDIIFGRPWTMQEFVDNGYFMGLKDKACMADVLPVLMDECTVNDGVYGLPIDVQVRATFYNKKMFQEAGAEVPVAKGGFFRVCDTLMDQGVHPLVHPYNLMRGVFHELDSFFTSIAAVISNEDVWTDSQNGVKDLFGNPVVIEAMKIFSGFASYKDVGNTTIGQTQGIQNFAASQRPIHMNDGWLMGNVIAASPDEEFGMSPTPRSDNSEENKLWIGTDDVFVVSQQTRHRDEVMTLLNLSADEESFKTWMGTAKFIISNIAVPTDDADAFIKKIKSYIDNDMIVSKSLMPGYTSGYSTAFRTKLQGSVTLDDSQRDVTKLLKDINNKIASIQR